MPKFDPKQADAAVELARLLAPSQKGKSGRLLNILADQLEASTRLLRTSLARARERELSQVLNILEEQEGAMADAFSLDDEEDTKV